MKRFFLTISILVFVSISYIFPQSYLGKNHTLQLSEDDMTALYNGQTDLHKMADFFFTKSYSDIQKLVKSKNLYPESEEGTFYIDGKLLRIDMNMMGQQASFIINLETRKAYNILYAQKAYIEMDLDELKAMKEKMEQNMATQMEGMKGMMENLPPEARAAMEEMSGKKEKAPSEVKATGKSKTINGFPCKEYLAISNDEHEQAWITSDNPAVKTAFFEIANAMPMDEESGKKWETADGWPVQTSQIRSRKGYVEGSYTVSETYSLEKVTHKAGTFDPPKGFQKRTMQDMMQGMPQAPQNFKVD